jgi:YHS domain-containing protein
MEETSIFILIAGGFIIYMLVMLGWRNPKMFLPKCKNCGKSAKWVFTDKKTGKKYYFCKKKCEKEYFRNNLNE